MSESPKYAEEVRSMPREAGLAPVDPPAPAAAPPAGALPACGRTGALVPGPVPGRLVLQDEGGAQVTLDVYATGTRAPLARVQVGRDLLPGYALDLLRAGLRR